MNNFLQTVPALLLTIYKVTKSATAGLSEFNFLLTAIDAAYTTSQSKDSKNI